MIDQWMLPETLKQDYINACNEAVKTKDFEAFKKHPAANCIVENSTQEWADRIRYGTGIEYPGMSPNEVRYAYTWLILSTLIRWDDYKKVSEIGGGYGGMCQSIFNHDFLSAPLKYYLYDLPEAMDLQAAYLNTKVADYDYDKCMFIDSTKKAPPHDICIAWCSWSELDQQAKRQYIGNVMSQSKHIFIASNWDYTGDLELLKSLIPNVKEYTNPYMGKIIYT